MMRSPAVQRRPPAPSIETAREDWDIAPMPAASDSLSGRSLPDAVQHTMDFLRSTITRSGTLDRVRHAPDALDEQTAVALRMIRNAAAGRGPQKYSTIDFHQTTGASILLRTANCSEAALLAGRLLVEQGAVEAVTLVACIGRDENMRKIDHAMLHLSGRASVDRQSETPFFFDPFMGLLSNEEQVRYLGRVSTHETLGNDPVLFRQTAGQRNMHVYAADVQGKGYVTPYSRAREFDHAVIGTVTKGADGRAVYNGDPLMFGKLSAPQRAGTSVPTCRDAPSSVKKTATAERGGAAV